ncbi:MAG: DUF4382 domain-containing protein [Bacteroidetes bacterium]|jgi:hypothetical protein|nr:DUF4382 domain-containing protein [Bacteroidota bacterium]
MKKRNALISFAALAVFALFMLSQQGCEKNNNTNPPGNPVFSVKLIDAPSAYDAVNVEIVGMEANIGTGWITLEMDNSGVYNLLSFTNGNSLALINDVVMTPCTISELRLILGTNNTVVVDGVSHELTTPSGQTSGYKVKMDSQQLIAGGVYYLVLDFNTQKSVHVTGNGKYMLKPVVSGCMETSIGSIAGTISPIEGAYYVEATNATDTSGTYINQTNGQFLIPAVMPGIYQVKFVQNAGHLEKIVPGVVVIIGQTTQMGTIPIE